MATRQPSKATVIPAASDQQTNRPLSTEAAQQLLGATLKSLLEAEVEGKIVPEIEMRVEEFTKKAREEIIGEIKDSKAQLETVRNSVMGAIAVFAAFFTFVSVNINIFSKADAKEGMALMIVMWICLMGFTYTFFLFLWDKWRVWRYWAPVVIGMAVNCGILYLTK